MKLANLGIAALLLRDMAAPAATSGPSSEFDVQAGTPTSSSVLSLEAGGAAPVTIPTSPAAISDEQSQLFRVAGALGQHYHSEVLRMGTEAPEFMAKMLAEIKSSKISDEDLRASLLKVVRPPGSFLHKSSPCLTMIRQRDVVFIDGLNWNRAESIKNGEFWWEPVTSIPLLEFKQAVDKLREAVVSGASPSFMAITPTIGIVANGQTMQA